ncbi:thermostable hemolysin [Aquipseudomonas guryensis]|uniref:Thermostable hemolysin n=1 Tax=Aquipseudomonas guryensis TaxID=2759165 RepID=A0A7W4DDP2_9GAMM|nr:thermostable hemolysin [Pseudomonas guryensis]MBB1520648.1 thermostable hemolysin [Pseudomonas guryensis]
MHHPEWNTVFPLHFGADPQSQSSLCLVGEQDQQRAAYQHFIHQRFNEAHGARVSHFMPELLGLRTPQAELTAVCGARLARSEELFLEQYLQAPVESVIARLAERPVSRSEIVEVGNLAAISPGNARLIIIAMTCLLARRGLQWVVFTGAATLINSFRRLGLEPLRLCEADPQRLGEQQHDWGQYYAQRPQVFAGNIQLGYRQLCEQGVLQRLGFFLCEDASHAA